jgi:hypothetical protein
VSAPGRFAGRLNRRQQECHENANDRDDYQQLDEREAARRAAAMCSRST